MPRTKNVANKSQSKKVNIKELTCVMCGNTKRATEFNSSFNPIHQTGKLPYCKSCLKSMCLDSKGNININKVKDMLKLIDRPFRYEDFKSASEDKNDTIGTYLKNIALNYRNDGWKDSIFEPQCKSEFEGNNSDDKLVYSKKWVGNYSQTDIEYLDNYLKGLHNDFKIITENHKDYAKKIAKASLHMDKCFQEMIEGVSGADKRYKDARETFDTLSKSAQFSENTRGINDVSLGGYGVTFEKVEQKVWIPTHTPIEKDDIDKLIDYFTSINKSIG